MWPTPHHEHLELITIMKSVKKLIKKRKTSKSMDSVPPLFSSQKIVYELEDGEKILGEDRARLEVNATQIRKQYPQVSEKESVPLNYHQGWSAPQVENEQKQDPQVFEKELVPPTYHQGRPAQAAEKEQKHIPPPAATPVFKVPWLVLYIGCIVSAVVGWRYSAGLRTHIGSGTITESIKTRVNIDMSSPVIAIMGGSGAGKSSFIRALDGRDENGTVPEIGHGLQSCGSGRIDRWSLLILRRYQISYLVFCIRQWTEFSDSRHTWL